MKDVKVCPCCKSMTLLEVLDESQQETLRRFGMATHTDRGLRCKGCGWVGNESDLTKRRFKDSEVAAFIRAAKRMLSERGYSFNESG